MANIKYFLGEKLPLEMHKVRTVQRLNLVPLERRLEAIKKAGNNTFLLFNKDIYLDMLTDSGVNAMSDQQVAAMMVVDDSYAGSATFTRLKDKLEEITVNLSAPLIINMYKKMGKQIILNNQKYRVKYPLFSSEEFEVEE